MIEYAQVDMEREYCFTAVVDEEKSLVCVTDHILTKKENSAKAMDVLSNAGYQVI